MSKNDPKHDTMLFLSGLPGNTGPLVVGSRKSKPDPETNETTEDTSGQTISRDALDTAVRNGWIKPVGLVTGTYRLTTEGAREVFKIEGDRHGGVR